MAQVIKIGMDVSDIKGAAAEMASALQGDEAAVTSLFRKMAETNKEGQLTKQVFQGIASDGSKVEMTLRKVADGWAIVGTRVREATEKIRQAAREQAAAAGQATARRGENLLGGTFNTEGLSLSQASSVETAIQRIKSTLASGKVEFQRFEELLAKFRASPRGVMPGLSEEEARIVKSFRTIQNAIEQAGRAKQRQADEDQRAAQKSVDAAARAAAAETRRAQLRTAGQVGETLLRSSLDFSRADPSKLAAIEAAMARIRSQLESGRVSLEKFQAILNTLKSGPNKILLDMNAQEQSVARAIRTIVKGLGEDVPQAVDKSRSVFISLGGILRLLEAQVLKRIFSVLENELLNSIGAAQRFTIQVAEIRTISQEAQLSTQQWSEGITELSNKFGKTQADVAEGVYQTLSNQVAKGAEAFKFMDEALGFSQATVTSATNGVNLLSGALRSFQLPTSDAARVGAILFKTIELGRVRADEMAATFGRVGTLAADAGVKLEETSAAIALLTNRGIKFQDASTLVQNILLKLIRPTDEMKKLFDEWGVASGTAAIATFGFEGVLKRLDDEARKGTGRLGDLLGQIRAIRGVVGLTGGAFNEFQDYLSKITGGQSQYERAKQEIAQSPGQRAMKELTQLRNFLEQDFGEKFLNAMLKIVDAAGGLVNILKGVNLGVQAGVIAFGLYKLAVLASTPPMLVQISLSGILAAVKLKLAAAVLATNLAFNTFSFSSIPAAAAAMVRFTATVVAAAAPFAAFTALFASGAYLGYKLFIEDTTKSVKELRDAAAAAAEDAQKKRQGISDAERKTFDKGVDDTKRSYERRFQVLLNFSTAVVRKANEMRQASIENMKQVTESLKVSAGTYFDSLRQRVQAFQDQVTESKGLIRASLKETEDLPRRATNRIFEEKFKFASEGTQDPLTGFIVGDQKVEMLKARIVDLAAKAREEFGKGTKESVEEGRKLFNDVERLQSQLFEAETAKQRRQFDFGVRTGQIGPTGFDSLGRPQFEFVVRTAELERQINATTEERLKLEREFRAEQEARQKAAQAEADREKERIRALQQQFALLEKINVFNAEGKLKEEFRGPGGLDRALSEFDRRREEITRLAGADTREGLQVFRDLSSQRAALIREIRTAMQQETAIQIQEGVTRDKQSVMATLDGYKTAFKTFQESAAASVRGLDSQISIYREKILSPLGSPTEAGFQRAEPKRQEAIARLEDLQRARDAFEAQGGRTAENARRIQEAIEAVNRAMLEYIQLRGMDPRTTALRGDPSGLTLTQQAGATSALGDQLTRSADSFRQVENQLSESRRQVDVLETKLRGMPEVLQANATAASENGPRISLSLGQMAQQASNYADQLERINTAFARMSGQNPAGPQLPPLPGNEAPGSFFGGMRYYNAGGYVGFVPRGSDQVPAMLGRDEFVMTAQATKQFMPLLKAMNAGTMPRYMNQGGPVTNVGDITVNVSGGQTDERTIRNIATGLRRGIRRGTISLNA